MGSWTQRDLGGGGGVGSVGRNRYKGGSEGLFIFISWLVGAFDCFKLKKVSNCYNFLLQHVQLY